MPTGDFVTDVAIWTITGLLAVSGTPAAAIAFITVAPSFVVAMRTGNLGGIIQWYVDGVPTATIDTHSDEPGIVRVTMAGDPDLEEHQIYAVKDDDPDTVIEIVRKELSEDEARPQGTRYNTDCECVQTLIDGVWTDNPQADPRTATAYQYPAPDTADPSCDASARIVAAIQRILETMFTAAGVLEAVNAIIAVIAVFFPPVALFVVLLFALVNAANAFGFAAVELAFTPEVYDTLLCLIKCNIGADGQFTDDEWNSFQDAVGAEFGISVVTAILSLMFNGLGKVGFNNMASVGTETGDCDDCSCGWCWEWDFTIDQQGWEIYGIYGNYVPGIGFQSVTIGDAYSLIAVNTDIVFYSWQFVGVTVEYNIPPGFDDASIIQIGTTDGVTFPEITSWNPINSTVPNTYTSLATVDIVNPPYINPNGGNNAITATVKSILIRGIDEIPAFAYGHEC